MSMKDVQIAYRVFLVIQSDTADCSCFRRGDWREKLINNGYFAGEWCVVV